MNLFGEKDNKLEFVMSYRQLGKRQKIRKYLNYRLGNKEKSCRNCSHCIKFDYHNKVYYKCEIIGVSNSTATDIRLKNVCDKHQLKMEL
jgi:hypothetical protein